MKLDSLRVRLIGVLLGLLTALSFATALATLNAMQKEQNEQSMQALDVASRVFAEALHTRSTQLSSSVRLLASDFGFRQAVALREQDTIDSVLANHAARIDASFAVLLSPQGAMLASNNSKINSEQIKNLFTQAQATGSESIADIVYSDHSAYQLVMVPVKAPLVIAWVGMGFQLDQTLANQIKGITDLDISFTANQAGQMDVLASTLPQLDVQLFARNTASDGISTDWLSTSIALDQNNRIEAWLHLATARYQQNYQQTRAQLLAIFGVGLTLALVLALWFARSVTKPLQHLTEFAQALGQNLTTPVPKIRGAEVAVLASTLDQMRGSLAEREQQIQYQSQHDRLTGLANRLWVEQQLPTLLRQVGVQLLLVNIKDFKHVNDAFGYHNGDLLLGQLARRLEQTDDLMLLARLGNDEFLLVLPAGFAEADFRRWQQQWSTEFRLGESALNLKLALALYTPPTAVDVNDALRRVDIAMVHAKQDPALFARYQSGQDESHQRELMLLHDLPLSLQSGQMFVVYQPKVDIQQRQTHHAEALIRWQHPKLGFVPPDEFIRLAEHSGLISSVTDWMIEQVIQQVAHWQQQTPVQVAVNLSAYDLLNPQLPDFIQSLLQRYQVPASYLALEVTEGAVMQDPQQVIQNLQRLRSMGISLAIDDFGTGQSSLAYLKRLPVHEVKIDRAFVKDIENNLNDRLIVATTTSLAHGLGLKVTAEGLENAAGLSLLLEANVDIVQGYYFSKPLKAEDFEAWLQQFQQQVAHWFD
ncbi:MAG TPA: GGDEF domain-containing protein [Rheinheimera sp.]|nr:GGDEF domain-containing protein [Rheinheimera sp.]